MYFITHTLSLHDVALWLCIFRYYSPTIYTDCFANVCVFSHRFIYFFLCITFVIVAVILLFVLLALLRENNNCRLVTAILVYYFVVFVSYERRTKKNILFQTTTGFHSLHSRDVKWFFCKWLIKTQLNSTELNWTAVVHFSFNIFKYLFAVMTFLMF